MKIKHVWSLLCEKSIVNQDDNIISLISILEEVNTVITPTNPNASRPEKINIPFNFEIVSYWTKDLSDEVKMQVKTDVFDPNNKELSSIINESIFPKDQQKLRARLKVQGLPVTINGNYYIRISIKTETEKDYKLVAELPLSIKLQIEKPKNSAD